MDRKHLTAALAAAATDTRAVRAAGTYVVYGAAVLASLGTLYELALHYAGWNAGTAFLFAIVIDIYWLTALHTAIDGSLPPKKRVQAALHAFAAIGISVAGNILYHELHVGNWHLGHASGALTAAMASIPLLAAAALTHLRALGRPAKPSQRNRPKADQQKARTVPANHPGVTEPSQPAVPGHPSEPSQDEDAPASAAEGEEALPRELKAGGRPDPVAVAKAREIFAARLRSGELLNRRTLAAAVNGHYGLTVLGETSAARVIDEHRGRRTA